MKKQEYEAFEAEVIYLSSEQVRMGDYTAYISGPDDGHDFWGLRWNDTGE